MAIKSIPIREYTLTCDVCGDEQVTHSMDGMDNGKTVSSANDAIKHLHYHRSHGELLCDECFKERKMK